MSRQPCARASTESTQLVCPRCEGHGRVRGVESLSLSVLRLVEEQAMKENSGQVLVQVPANVANFLLNEKRKSVAEIELRHQVPIIVVADDKLETPHFEIQRIRRADVGEETKPSYERVTPIMVTPPPQVAKPGVEPEAPAVAGVKPSSPAPLKVEVEEAAPVVKTNGGFFAWLKNLFAAQPERTIEAPKPVRPAPVRTSNGSGNRSNRPEQRGGQRGGNRDRNEPRHGKDGRGKSEPRSNEPRGGEPRGNQPRKPQPAPAAPNKPAVTANEQPRAPKPAAPVQPVTSASAPATAPVVAALARVDSATVPDNGTTPTGDETPRSRRRGRRGGRRRRKHDDQAVAADTSSDAAIVFDFDDEDGDHDVQSPQKVSSPSTQSTTPAMEPKPVMSEKAPSDELHHRAPHAHTPSSHTANDDKTALASTSVATSDISHHKIADVSSTAADAPTPVATPRVVVPTMQTDTPSPQSPIIDAPHSTLVAQSAPTVPASTSLEATRPVSSSVPVSTPSVDATHATVSTPSGTTERHLPAAAAQTPSIQAPKPEATGPVFMPSRPLPIPSRFNPPSVVVTPKIAEQERKVRASESAQLPLQMASEPKTPAANGEGMSTEPATPPVVHTHPPVANEGERDSTSTGHVSATSSNAATDEKGGAAK